MMYGAHADISILILSLKKQTTAFLRSNGIYILGWLWLFKAKPEALPAAAS